MKRTKVSRNRSKRKGIGFIALAIVGLAAIMGIGIGIIMPTLILRFHLNSILTYKYKHTKGELAMIALLSSTDENGIQMSEVIGRKIATGDVESLNEIISSKLNKMGLRCYIMAVQSQLASPIAVNVDNCDPGYRTVAPIPVPSSGGESRVENLVLYSDWQITETSMT